MNTSECKTFSSLNKCCKLNYDNPFGIDIDEQITHCNGQSNITLCSWFKSIYISEIDIIIERKKIRKLRRGLNLDKKFI